MDNAQENNHYYSRKLAIFPSIESVVMQFVVGLCLYNENQQKPLDEITFMINRKLETSEKFRKILDRVLPGIQEFSNDEMESVLNSFLFPNEEIVLGVKNGLYFVKEYGDNYERIEG